MSTPQNYAATSYRRTNDCCARQNREALIEAHLPQVKYIAERLATKLPPSVEINDLMGAGMLGLLDAVEKYDTARGVMFKTYAEMRVRGAMLDSLRDLDWAPRSMRRRAREVEAAYITAERLRGHATEANVATILGISLNEFQTLLGNLSGLTITGFSQTDDDENSALHDLPADIDRTPLAEYERVELQERLTQAVDCLPHRERQVIALYYVEELTMKEIGATLGVTESRVSQIHTQAVIRLRASLSTLRASLALAS